MTNLDDLYEAVSRAIADAEGMPDERSRDAAAAWLHVARLERAIAEQTAASAESFVPTTAVRPGRSAPSNSRAPAERSTPTRRTLT